MIEASMQAEETFHAPLDKLEKERALRNKMQREYRKNNKEKLSEYFKKYNEKNKEKKRANQKKYRENNREKINKYKREYNNRKKEKRLECTLMETNEN